MYMQESMWPAWSTQLLPTYRFTSHYKCVAPLCWVWSFTTVSMEYGPARGLILLHNPKMYVSFQWWHCVLSNEISQFNLQVVVFPITQRLKRKKMTDEVNNRNLHFYMRYFFHRLICSWEQWMTFDFFNNNRLLPTRSLMVYKWLRNQLAVFCISQISGLNSFLFCSDLISEGCFL